MLVRQQATAGTAVLSVVGQVLPGDLPGLQSALSRALALAPRGVVLDLGAASTVDPRLARVVAGLGTTGASRPALVVCGAPPELEPALGEVQPDRSAALAAVDDAHTSARERVCVPDGLTGPAAARAATTAWAHAHGLGALAPDLALVVTELVSNAVRHGCPPVVVELASGPDEVLVAVGDGSDDPPARRTAQDDDEGGRGLELVELLSTRTGVRADPPGKTVWASLPRTSGPAA